MSEIRHLYLGIDIGTTNSLLSFYSDEKIELLSFENDKTSEPSWIQLYQKDPNDEKSKELKFGKTAKDSLTHSTSTIFDVKKFIGRGFDEVRKGFKHWPFELVDNGNNIPSVKLQPEDTNEVEIFRSEVLTGWLITYLIKQIFKPDQKLEKRIIHVVMTIPVNFKETQKEAMEKACRLAGMKMRNEVEKEQPGDIILEKLMYEPEAALKDYSEYKSKDIKPIEKGSHVLVCDFGGGTFDLSLFKKEKDFFKKIRSSGDNDLGGNEFDDVMTELLKENEMIENIYIKIEETKKSLKSKKEELDELERQEKKFELVLKKVAEETKINLFTEIEKVVENEKVIEIKKDTIFKHFDDSKLKEIINGVFGENGSIVIDLESFINKCCGITTSNEEDGNDYSDEITDDENENYFIVEIPNEDEYELNSLGEKPILIRIDEFLNEFLKQLGDNVKSINYVLFIGGTCKMKFLRDMIISKIKNKYGKSPTELYISENESTGFNLMTAVCKGACRQCKTICDSTKTSSNGFVDTEEYLPITEPIGIAVERGKIEYFIDEGTRTDKINDVIFKLSNKKQKSVTFNFYSGTSHYTNSQNVRFLGSKKIVLSDYIKENVDYDDLRLILKLIFSPSGLITDVVVTFQSISNQEIMKEGKENENHLGEIVVPSLCGYSRGDMEEMCKKFESYAIPGLDDNYKELISEVHRSCSQFYKKPQTK